MQKTFEWHHKAAEQGHDTAQAYIGEMYRLGIGIDQDYGRAFEWFNKAADQGNALAQVAIGLMYKNGEYVDRNYDATIIWYRKAIESNEVSAYNNLAWLLATAPDESIRDGF